MSNDRSALLTISFTAQVIHWRGPAPFFFAPLPVDHAVQVREVARLASYGWGCIPVEANAGGATFRTSLFPKDGGYMLPLKVAVRNALGIAIDDEVTIEMAIYPPG